MKWFNYFRRGNEKAQSSRSTTKKETPESKKELIDLIRKTVEKHGVRGGVDGRFP